MIFSPISNETCTGYLAPLTDVAFGKFMLELATDLDSMMAPSNQLLGGWKLFDSTKYDLVKAEVLEILPHLRLLIWGGRADYTLKCEAEIFYDFLSNEISIARTLLVFMRRISGSANPIGESLISLCNVLPIYNTLHSGDMEVTKKAFVKLCNVFPICDTCGGLGHTNRRMYSEREPERQRSIKKRRLERLRSAEIEELAIEASI